MARRSAAVLRGRHLALISLLAALIVIAGPTVPASAVVHCQMEANGAISSPPPESFHGDAVVNLDGSASGSWFHVVPGVGTLVKGTVTTGNCLVNGSAVVLFHGSGRWRGQPVFFDVDVRDDFRNVPQMDAYSITICAQADCSGPADPIYESAFPGDLTRGDISTTFP